MQNSTAAIVIIGNEILSGRTLDKNTHYIAGKLSSHGIDLKEVRIIPDNELIIINCIDELKKIHSYIFTTGGIGPTHDDITTAAIAKLFNQSLEINDYAFKEIEKFYQKRNQSLNEARIKMAFLPQNCQLINNPVSSAPGFIIENVYVLPGVPSIMQKMFDLLLEKIPQGDKVSSMNIDVMIPESLLAADFSLLQLKYPEIEMGSYPFERDNDHGTSLVLRSNNYKKLAQAHDELSKIIKDNFS